MPGYYPVTDFIQDKGRNRMKAKLQWRLTPALSALSAAAGTKRLLTLAAGALFALPAFAQSAIDYCAKARDPARCEARQAALKNCG